MRPEIELVSTGAELLSGRSVNTHAQTLGRALVPLGYRLVRDTTVPDDLGQISEAVGAALQRVDLVTVSGGLGPTTDDVTREAVAALLNRGIRIDEASLEPLREKYRRLGRPLSPVSERQVRVIEGAEVLPNSAGMAPGLRLDWNGKQIFILPGPPAEFSAVLEEHVLPWLAARQEAAGRLTERIFMVCGLGESDIGARMESCGYPDQAVDVAYCASTGQVEVRLMALESNREAIEKAAGDVRRALGSNIFSEGRSSMEEVAGRLLRERGLTLATAESCTGGLVGHKLTSVGGSSAYYLGGIIAYSNAIKVSELGVKPDTLERFGAVSENTALEMAEGARRRFGADYALSLTGIAGPSGGTPEKPVGLVFIACGDSSRTTVFKRQFSGSRLRIKEWSAQMALDHLRRRLLDLA